MIMSDIVDKFMEQTKPMSLAELANAPSRTYIAGIRPDKKEVLVGGLGCMGVGQMWFEHSEYHKTCPGYNEAEVIPYPVNYQTLRMDAEIASIDKRDGFNIVTFKTVGYGHENGEGLMSVPISNALLNDQYFVGQKLDIDIRVKV